MSIIDLRCRPSYLHDFFGRTPGTPEFETARWLNRRVGTRGDDEHFLRSATKAGFLAEIREAGLSRAVVVGRHTPAQHLPNDLIHEIVLGHRELIGIGSVDPVLQGERGAIEEIERATGKLGLKGIDIEPGFGSPPRHPDDRTYWPLYERLQELGVPLFLMSGPTTPDPRFNDPSGVAVVAAAFPRLQIAVYHGYWPRVQETIGVAFRHANVHLIPDMYLFQPGQEAYVKAANSFLADQFLFGSSYPFRPIRQSIDDYATAGFRPGVLDKVFHKNAERLLKLA